MHTHIWSGQKYTSCYQYYYHMVTSEWWDHGWILLSSLNCSVSQRMTKKYYEKESQEGTTCDQALISSAIIERMQKWIKSTSHPI